MKNATAAQSTAILQWASFDNTISERSREKKEEKEKKGLHKAKKGGKLCLPDSWPHHGIKYRREAGIIQETAVAGLVGDQ